ncbi:MAG: hypothetical protein II135_08420, partial [Clostridia bacterium]|nr:hypothetical protein [Clostridia bacterium]
RQISHAKRIKPPEAISLRHQPPGVGDPPQKEYSYFTRFARTEFHLRRGSPKMSLPSFRGFSEANFAREAYLTAEGDFTAASAARGGGSPRATGSIHQTAERIVLQARNTVRKLWAKRSKITGDFINTIDTE